MPTQVPTSLTGQSAAQNAVATPVSIKEQVEKMEVETFYLGSSSKQAGSLPGLLEIESDNDAQENIRSAYSDFTNFNKNIEDRLKFLQLHEDFQSAAFGEKGGFDRCQLQLDDFYNNPNTGVKKALHDEQEEALRVLEETFKAGGNWRTDLNDPNDNTRTLSAQEASDLYQQKHDELMDLMTKQRETLADIYNTAAKNIETAYHQAAKNITKINVMNRRRDASRDESLFTQIKNLIPGVGPGALPPVVYDPADPNANWQDFTNTDVTDYDKVAEIPFNGKDQVTVTDYIVAKGGFRRDDTLGDTYHKIRAFPFNEPEQICEVKHKYTKNPDGSVSVESHLEIPDSASHAEKIEMLEAYYEQMMTKGFNTFDLSLVRRKHGLDVALKIAEKMIAKDPNVNITGLDYNPEYANKYRDPLIRLNLHHQYCARNNMAFEAPIQQLAPHLDSMIQTHLKDTTKPIDFKPIRDQLGDVTAAACKHYIETKEPTAIISNADGLPVHDEDKLYDPNAAVTNTFTADPIQNRPGAKIHRRPDPTMRNTMASAASGGNASTASLTPEDELHARLPSVPRGRPGSNK